MAVLAADELGRGDAGGAMRAGVEDADGGRLDTGRGEVGEGTLTEPPLDGRCAPLVGRFDLDEANVDEADGGGDVVLVGVATGARDTDDFGANTILERRFICTAVVDATACVE